MMRFPNETNGITRWLDNMSSQETANPSGWENFTDATQKALVINCAINIPLALTSIVGNALVLHAVWKTPTLRSPSMLLLCSLALSDLEVGAVVQPLLIATDLIAVYSQSERLKRIFLSVYNIFGYSLCGVSLCTVAAISVDRLIAIQKSLQYSSLVTIPRIRRILVAIWTIGVIFASSPFWEENIRLGGMIIVICVCLCISTISHVKIYRIVRHHQNAIQIQLHAVETNHGVVNNNMLGLKKSALNAFIVFLALIICYCPYLVVYAVSTVYPINLFLAISITCTIVLMNSALNPFLYCWRLFEIREVVLQTCRKLVCCK